MTDARALLDAEAVVLGDTAAARALEPWRALCAEAARVIWSVQTDQEGKLAIALLPGALPLAGSARRVVVGAYSPETRTIVVFIDALEQVRRQRTWLRQLLRTLAHEVTHAVQHRANPAVRPGRRGSATLGAAAYDADALERQAAREQDAFDLALFSPDAPAELADRVDAYRGAQTARLVELIDALEREGSAET